MKTAGRYKCVSWYSMSCDKEPFVQTLGLVPVTAGKFNL